MILPTGSRSPSCRSRAGSRRPDSALTDTWQTAAPTLISDFLTANSSSQWDGLSSVPTLVPGVIGGRSYFFLLFKENYFFNLIF